MKQLVLFFILTLQVLCEDSKYILIEINSTNVVAVIFLIIYLSMSWNVIYSQLGSKIIEEAIFMTCDTENDNVMKPFVYFISNTLFIIPPVV